MASCEKRIHSALKTISVLEVKAAVQDILSNDFTEKEHALFEMRPAQSIAGQLALKSAVCQLAEEIGAAVPLTCRQVEISRQPSGAPTIGSVSSVDTRLNGVLKSALHLSISHTKTTAVGLAVISEVIDTGENE